MQRGIKDDNVEDAEEESKPEIEEEEESYDDEEGAESNYSAREIDDEAANMDLLKPYNFDETMIRRESGSSNWFDILGEKEQKEMF